MNDALNEFDGQLHDVNYLELLDSLENGVLLLDKQARIIFINRWFLSHIKTDATQLHGLTLQQVFADTLSEHFLTAISDACQHRLGRMLSFQFHKQLLPLVRRLPTGEEISLNVSVLLRPQKQSELTLLQCQDVTNSVRREQHLKANEQILKTERQTLEMIAMGQALEKVSEHLCKTAERLLKNVRAAMLMLNADGESFDVLSAPSFSLMFHDFIGQFESPTNAATCRQAFRQKQLVSCPNIRLDETWQGAIADAQPFNIVACWAMPVVSARNDVIGVLAIYPLQQKGPDSYQRAVLERLTHLGSIAFERHQHIERINYLAMHDSLTGLANRSLLTEHLSRNLHRAQREKQRFGLLFIDLDGFKQVNDHHGHDAGDDLLTAIAQRLQRKLRQTDICARIGGDEFVVVLESVTNLESALMVADQICALIAEPVKWGAAELRVSASIGVAIYPEDGSSTDALLNKADDAMYAAKAAGKNRSMWVE